MILPDVLESAVDDLQHETIRFLLGHQEAVVRQEDGVARALPDDGWLGTAAGFAGQSDGLPLGEGTVHQWFDELWRSCAKIERDQI